jgi:hypothetical protein
MPEKPHEYIQVSLADAVGIVGITISVGFLMTYHAAWWVAVPATLFLGLVLLILLAKTH